MMSTGRFQTRPLQKCQEQGLGDGHRHAKRAELNGSRFGGSSLLRGADALYEPISERDRIVLPTIVRVHLEHAGDPQVRDRRPELWKLVVVVDSHDWLRDRGVEDPSIDDP